MTGWGEIEYTAIRELRGPLAVVEGVAGVGWDEFVRITLDSGEERHGLVLEVDRGLAVVQVLEDTAGMDPARVRMAFAGQPLRIPVGSGWLGRVCNGRGDPIDGGPPVFGSDTAAVAGNPINPVRREPPGEPVLTGVGVMDALTTLVRGQKLPVFSIAGLPHLELAVQIAAQSTAAGEAFSVVFAGMGLTHADASLVRDALEERSAAGELVLLLNTADDPVIERILTPRIALTVAEHLAFEGGRHVLVVMTDMTSYAEALREVSAARGEVPARRAYPGYLYSDLASLYERCGRIRGRPGSVTVLPVLTMPAGDITHPVPDLTGYITEGQIVLSRETHALGVYPPVDALSSLSRLMRKGAGPGRTRPDHLDVAAQMLAALARARQVRELADLVGQAALSPTDRRYLNFDEAFLRRFVHQHRDELRTLDETLEKAWQVLLDLPRSQLAMLPAQLLDARGAERG
ncbi:V-type ATP synthase subunit B [Streptomyces hirsutus]|uniref:V-type ATP synthase beta chain n=1 Tax=Streptomyces hirsutus TaxID=35620 RepID=A0ABZ1GIH6_9ACTN|nr:V-type ATP synthase subunit B [Streptomyces hirsutus]WSD04969.1 V-type ATP synthase subunit B [Streptomyces hirsutus]WTD21638.1 V-type ATP synthase subunit B [Streptomyces hirsutus]